MSMTRYGDEIFPCGHAEVDLRCYERHDCRQYRHSPVSMRRYRCEPRYTPHVLMNREIANLRRHLRPAAGTGFPFPKQTKAFAVPMNQCVGFDDDQRIPPIEPSGESCESKTDRIVGSARPHLPLSKKGRVVYEETHSRRQRRPQAENRGGQISKRRRKR